MNQATIDFIRKHAEADVRQLALQGMRNPEVDLTFALDQIAGRQKAKTKLPSWAAIDGITYPPHLSMEQCSSEQTAKYKGCLVIGDGCWLNDKKTEGSGISVSFVDLTGGFGVDFAFIASAINQHLTPNTQHLIYVEQQAQLCAISSENFKCLGLNHIEVVCADGVEYLHQLDHADLIFLDPARRDDHGARTYGIADCTPNVLELREELLEKADRVMLKLSPMLDWRKAVEDLGNVNEVHIVSVDNECKELLLILSKEEKPLKLFCVNNDQVFEVSDNVTGGRFFCDTASDVTKEPSPCYIFEPNASIMKAGCFALLEQRFRVSQLDKNSHLFVSDSDISDFPGRRFIIEKTTSMNKRELKAALAGIDKANITVRNFPMSVAELRKRLKLKEGGDLYLFATTIAGHQHQLFLCRKIE